ncbi:MAG TPA: hypothetical protein VGW38_25365 [Chloroflexota bacterium]|nr:hypothetical protein [Chloroflexota bacterium]
MMIRRSYLVVFASGLAATGLVACQQNAEQSGAPSTGAAAAAPTGKQDLKKVAASLSAKTTTMIDAVNAKNDANIQRAKADLQKEADSAEDAVKSETGPVANQINAAVGLIRSAVLANDVPRLERAKGLLQQAAQ